MAPIVISRPGPIRTAKTPKRVRFAGEDREQTKLIRQQEAEKRDARSLPRVDVDVSTSYELPVVTAAAGALFNYAKSTIGLMVEFGKTALTTSFGKVLPSLGTDNSSQLVPPKEPASMLEYPPFLAGATPNVVKKNRRDYYQSVGVMSSMQKAKSYAAGSTPARTPESMQSDKEKNWYRFHDTPYAGHKLDFGRGRSLLPPPAAPQYRFDSPTRPSSKHRSKPTKSPARKQQKSALKRRSRSRLADGVARRSNAEEFHANFSKKERNELYASYTRFLTALKFDVKQFASSLRNMCLPTEMILKVHDHMKRSDWDFFMKIMADEEYWAQVKGVGSTKVPTVPNYVEPHAKRPNVNPCEYCKSYEWAGKVEIREVENDGDEVQVIGQTKFDIPYSKEEQAHIDAGRFYKVFHRFCHESRYDWKFPDPSKPCSWEGQNHSSAKEGKWSISKYDPRLRHFPLLMQRMPKRMRQIQQELSETVMQLTAQDMAAWYYMQGVRRYNTRMAAQLEKMDLERKRRQVLWPCQLQVQVVVKSKPEPEPQVEEKVQEETTVTNAKRTRGDNIDEGYFDEDATARKRARFHINKPETAADTATKIDKDAQSQDGSLDLRKDLGNMPSLDSRKRARSEDIDMDDVHLEKKAHAEKPAKAKPSGGSFGLFDDSDTEDDMDKERKQEKAQEQSAANNIENDSQLTQEPKLTWLQKLDAMMKLREAELAAAEAERAKAEAEKEAQERTKREAEEKARKEAEERAKQEAEKEAAKAQAPKPSEEVPSIFSNKPLFPPVQTSTSSAPSKKPFVFEDPSPTQVQTVPTEDERAPLKEHTNGVKPMSPASTVPNLFGSAVPNLAPNSGFGFSTSSDISPFKPIGPTSVTGQGKTGAQPSLFGNEENIPTSTASATQAPLQSLFAPKPTGAPVFGFGANNITSTAPTGGLFASVSAPAQTETENKSTSLFGNKEEPPKDNNAPKPGAPSLFSGFNTAPAAPATTQPSSLFSAKPTETQQPATNLFSNLGPVNGGLFNNVSSAAPATTPAVTAAPGVGLFGATTTAPTAPANTSNLFGASSAPTTTAEAPKSIFSFDTKPAAAPFTFGGATSKPSEPAPAPTSLFDNATATTTATAPSSVPSVFNISGVGSTGNSMSGSFPTTSTPFTFGAGTTAPALAATSMSLSFPPATPAGQPPAFSFGGFKVNNNSTTPTKSSDVQNRLSEDISMASPEQSPQKSDSPKTFSIFGSINNNLANRNTTTTAASFGAGANKPFTFGQPAAPSSLKFSESAKPPTLNFGPVMGSQPAASPAMPATSGITSLPGAASKFEFGGFTGIPGAPAATAAPSMPGASTAAPFTFNATGLDFSLQPTPGRKIATPRRKFPKR